LLGRSAALGAGAAIVAAGGLARPLVVGAQNATPVASASPAAGSLSGGVALGNFSQIQDLSHIHSPAFPMFPGAEQMAINVLVTVAADGFYKNQLVLDEHTGTHMDAPAHFVTDGTTAELLPVEQLVAPLAVIDISARAAGDPDAQLIPDDILAWEASYGPLPAGAFVAMYSGWASRVGDAAAYLNVDAGGTTHFPGFHPDAAALLVAERDIVGIGVDTISIDYGASTDLATHLTVLSVGKYGIESLAALDTVPPSGATVIVGGPKHLAASGGPTRVLALF